MPKVMDHDNQWASDEDVVAIFGWFNLIFSTLVYCDKKCRGIHLGRFRGRASLTSSELLGGHADNILHSIVYTT